MNNWVFALQQSLRAESFLAFQHPGDRSPPGQRVSRGRDREMTDTTDLASIDVRTIPPRERHPRIFAMANALDVGKSFIIINDHDPRPLHYQLQAEYPGQFSWTYLDTGPEVWRVELGRQARV
jgi:uncharacterized protein (DUF2249 family)